MRRSLLLAALALAAMPMLGVGSAHAQATRTWISGVGDDVNPCSRTAPCKTFAGAISKTAAGGEINCLDPGGFGSVTITKSITLDCSGTFGSILSSGTNGININDSATATPGTIVVNVRGLAINGAGTGLVGINFASGFSLHLDNVIIENFNSGNANGIRFNSSTAGTKFLHVNNSFLWNNGIAPASGAGIFIQPGIAGATSVAVINNTAVEFGAQGITANAATAGVFLTVNHSSVSHNRGGGIAAQGGAQVMVTNTTVIDNSSTGVSSVGTSLVRINNSTIFGNQTGVGGGGNLRSYKNNAINGNGVDGTPVTQEILN